MFSVRRTSAALVVILHIAAAGYAQVSDEQQPCEAFSQSASVFIGVAQPPVNRVLYLPDQPPFRMNLTPMVVERAYHGVTTPVVYVTPLGISSYATPGRKYLVYGREYAPGIVMASPGMGAKEIERAASDLEFLENVIPGTAGGTITGVIQQKERSYNGRTDVLGPLEGIRVRIVSEQYSTDAVSTATGSFSAFGLPDGAYQLVPELPEDLVVWDSTSRIVASVRDGGCAITTIDVLPNGRVRGVIRGPDGQPLRSTSVDLIPTGVRRDPISGHITGMGSVSTNDKGEFEFAGRPPGSYHLGVSLYHAPNPHGPSYPRTYYPGTTDPERAAAVIVERGRDSGWFEFAVPAILPKGELEVVVDAGGHHGELSMCFVQLEDRVGRRSVWPMQPGVPLKMPVVDGQPYEIHVHLKFPGGHFESEPYTFTATTKKAFVTLRPDSPRSLHSW